MASQTISQNNAQKIVKIFHEKVWDLGKIVTKLYNESQQEIIFIRRHSPSR